MSLFQDSRIVSFYLFVAMATAAFPAGETFYVVPIDRILITEGELPTNQVPRQRWRWRNLPNPRIWLGGEGEAYLQINDTGRAFNNDAGETPPWAEIAIAIPADAASVPTAIHGTMALPDEGERWDSPEDWRLVRFSLPVDTPTASSAAFNAIKSAHYEALRADDIPGAAWFRHQARAARVAAGNETDEADAQRNTWQRNRRRATTLEDTFDLFTGARAMAENLALDRLLATDNESSEPTIDVDSIEGITVEEIDWSQYRTVENPEIDPLAKYIPADQYAIFFPDFASLVKTIDEARENLTPILRALDPKAIDYMTMERYEKQLCLELDGMARLLGGTLIKSVAITGSDPYLRSGSDVAVLFETDQPEALYAAIKQKHQATIAAESSAQATTVQKAGMSYDKLATPNREILSFIGKDGNFIMVTNSEVQIRKLGDIKKGESPSIGSLEEYLYFREVYKKDDAEESALLIATDAAIRKWGGAEWRVGASRRARALALHSEAVASDYSWSESNSDELANDFLKAVNKSVSGVDLSDYGTLEFQTPIAELNIEKVTEKERDAYLQWKRGYERNWRQAFDPIAVRLNITDTELGADVTVMPLIAASDYREMIELTKGPALEPGDGDPHPEALLHFAVSLNPDSQTVQMAEGMMMSMAPSELQKPLGWVGDSAALYFDDSPLWAEWAAAEEPENFLESHFMRMPVGLYIDATNGLKLAAFLAAVRAFIEQSAPGMIRWQTMTHAEQQYVRVGPSPGTVDDDWNNFALYYSTSGGDLTFSLSEEVIQRRIDRVAKPTEAGATTDQSTEETVDDSESAESDAVAQGWLGEHYNMRAKRGVLDLLAALGEDEYHKQMQRASWGNIPILNEWRALNPEEEPATFHQKVWKERLVCPGGGSYVWNEKWQTMESTAYGHPAEPRKGPGLPAAFEALTSGDFGLTFLDDGVRARTILYRE